MSYTSRFKDLDWMKAGTQNISIGGVGGIGSWLVLFLSRIGHTLALYDFDTVDETNLGGQLYGKAHIGKTKINAITEVVRNLGCTNTIYGFGKLNNTKIVTPISFSCFDNMQARKIMFESWKKLDSKQLFVDGRMRAEYFEVYAVTPENIERYEQTLFDDAEVEDLPCSAKATSHCGATTASFMTNMLNSYLTNTQIEGLRMLPFKQSISMDLNLYEEE